jgi:phosphoserine phosphatase
LAEGQALEFKGEMSTQAMAELLSSFQVDWCLHNAPIRALPVLLCDMDSTIIGQECIDELADLAGVGEQVKAITAAAMAGELDFEQALKARVFLLKGQSEDILSQCWHERIQINPGAKTLIATLNQLGSKTVLVSGGFDWFTSRIAEQVGFFENHANALQTENGTLTGEISGDVLTGETKLVHLLRVADTPQNACAIGDGANDLWMVRAAGMGLAYCAKPVLEQSANGRIRHTDLTTALFFQGIKPKDWVMAD